MMGEPVLEEEEGCECGLLVVPGISSDTFSSPLKDILDVKSDLSVVRLDCWSSESDLEDVCLSDLHDLIEEGVDLLKDCGCSEVVLLGKSFGGMLALTCRVNVDLMFLLAPAVGVGSCNVDYWFGTELGEASSVSDIRVDEDFVSEIDCRVVLVHGTEDEIVPVRVSKDLDRFLINSSLCVFDGAGHSFEGFEEELASFVF